MKPILFSIGSFHIYTYGLMVALGVVLCLFLMVRRARLDHFPKVDDVYDLIFVVVVQAHVLVLFVVVVRAQAPLGCPGRSPRSAPIPTPSPSGLATPRASDTKASSIPQAAWPREQPQAQRREENL